MSGFIVIEIIIEVGTIIIAIVIGGSTFCSGQQNDDSVLIPKTASNTSNITSIINATSNNNSLANDMSSIQKSQGKQQSSINSTTASSVMRVAFVTLTFTYAAYQLNGFYNFYDKYARTPEGTNVTTDLNLLTVKVPHGLFLVYNQMPTDTPPPPREKMYIDTLMQHVENKTAPPQGNVKISDITDKEVGGGGGGYHCHFEKWH